MKVLGRGHIFKFHLCYGPQVRTLPSSLSDSLQDVLVTGDQLMHSATLNETADHSGFEYSWKFLE